MFHPTLGRWLQEDPIGFDSGDENLYRYVENSPTNALDPLGLAKWTLSGELGYADPRINPLRGEVTGTVVGTIKVSVAIDSEACTSDLKVTISSEANGKINLATEWYLRELFNSFNKKKDPSGWDRRRDNSELQVEIRPKPSAPPKVDYSGMNIGWKIPALDRNLTAEKAKDRQPSVVGVSAAVPINKNGPAQQRGIAFITLSGPPALSSTGEPSGTGSSPLMSALQQVYIKWEFDLKQPGSGDLTITQGPGSGPTREQTLK